MATCCRQSLPCLPVLTTLRVGLKAPPGIINNNVTRKDRSSYLRTSSRHISGDSELFGSRSKRVYGVPINDKLFKLFLDDEKVRQSFFRAFIPDLQAISSERLDGKMSPRKNFQVVREFVNNSKTKKIVDLLRNSEFEVRIKPTEDFKSGKSKRNAFKQSPKGTVFLEELITDFDGIIARFPKPEYDGAMDFVCELSTGGFALVEIQVARQDCWDMRSLMYLSSLYGKQLRTAGNADKGLEKVVGVNILGWGLENMHHLRRQTEMVRHYRLQDQLHKERQFIGSIELYQYSLASANVGIDNLTTEQRDWLVFLRKGFKMTEEAASRIETAAVRLAFQHTSLDRLTESQRADNDAYESKNYNIEGVLQEEREAARTEFQMELVHKMISQGASDDYILSIFGLTLAELEAAKAHRIPEAPANNLNQ